MSENLYKTETIEILAAMASGANQKLIIHTASGVYYGNLLTQDNLDDFTVASVFHQLFPKHRKSQIEPESPKAIWLANVTFVSNNTKTTAPTICIFIDQIAAVTIGDFE